MHIFDYDKALESLLSPEIMTLIATIHEYKGRQDFLLNAKDEVLDALIEVSREKSVVASNRIEGVSTPDYRLRDLFDEDAEPRDEDELAICAYRECFTSVLANYSAMQPTPESILALHKQLFSHLPSGGTWKSEDSAITEMDGEGRESALFRAVTAADTPLAMNLLCDAYGKATALGRFNPLLLTVVFIFDFLCIHPFQDGNGRMSRLLALLLTCRAGYMVGKYVSVDQIVEESRSDYYEALRASSRGWHENANDLKPFVEYILNAVLKAYKEFASRLDGLVHEHTSKSDRIRNVIAAAESTISKREILERCPDISVVTVSVVLKRLCDEGSICKTGNGRNAAYVRIE